MKSPARTSMVRINNGWFGGPGNAAPDVPRDERVLSEQDLKTYAASLSRNGFLGADAWYMNHKANAAYSAKSLQGGVLEMPFSSGRSTTPPARGVTCAAQWIGSADGSRLRPYPRGIGWPRRSHGR